MGNITKTEKFFIIIFGVLLTPFVLIRDYLVQPIKRFFGFLPEEVYEITPEQQAANEAAAANEIQKLNKQD